MQKAIRIGLNARSQAIKKARFDLKKQRKQAEVGYEQWAERNKMLTAKQVKAERKSRREDFLAGPLAADRDVGLQRGSYGSLDAYQARRGAPPIHVKQGPQAQQEEPAAGVEREWEGHGNEGNIVVGDRVCIVNGGEGLVGQIGTVNKVDDETGTLTLGNVNTVDVEIPAFMSPEERLRRVTAVDCPVLANDVRLVIRHYDEETGVEADVVVRHLRGGAPHYEREYGSNIPRHTRYVAGADGFEVPWPSPEIQDREREAADTPSKEVQSITYLPVIATPPLPPGVMDELYNKYSPARTRHDDAWIQQKIVEDARSLWYEKRHLFTYKKPERRPKIEIRAEQMQKGKLEDWKQTWQRLQQESPH